MQRVLAAVLASGLLAVPTSARAEGFNGLMAGVNGLLTFPVDPIAELIVPSNDFDELPAPAVLGRVVGFLAGTLRGVSRAGWGTLDVALTPLWVVPTLSPKARFEIIPFYEVDYNV